VTVTGPTVLVIFVTWIRERIRQRRHPGEQSDA
jgi:hypothetical protein